MSNSACRFQVITEQQSLSHHLGTAALHATQYHAQLLRICLLLHVAVLSREKSFEETANERVADRMYASPHALSPPMNRQTTHQWPRCLVTVRIHPKLVDEIGAMPNLTVEEVWYRMQEL